jgi:hypothetical protein
MQGQAITVGLRMTREQRAKLAALGGAAWVRAQIDRAPSVQPARPACAAR